MKTIIFLLGNRIVRMADVGGGGGTPAVTAAPAATPAPENNTSGIDFGDGKFWESTQRGNPQPTAAPLTQEQQQQQLDKYIQGMNFRPTITPEQAQKIQQGDMSPIQDMFQSLGQAIFKQTLLDSTKITNDVARKERDGAVRLATGVMDSRETIRILETTVPLARDPVISPVARAVMQQAMGKGQTAEQAAETTRKYFQKVQSATHEDLGLPKPKPSARNFPGPQGPDAEPETDWMAFVNGEV